MRLGRVVAAAALAALAVGTGNALAAGSWTKLSTDGGSSVTWPSVALLGNQIVAGWARGAANAAADEIVTFTPDKDPKKLAASIKRVNATSGWGSLNDPILFKSGAGLQVLLGGTHSNDNSDQLNGTSFAPRNPDGSFGAAASSGLFGGATTSSAETAIAGPDGTTPIFVTNYGGGLKVYVGATGVSFDNGVVLADRGILGSHVEASGSTLGRDGQGRYWLVWYNSYTGTNGVYALQIDPASGAPIGDAQKAPKSEGGLNFGRARFALACRKTCRVVYHTESGGGLLSWAPGEGSPAAVKGPGNNTGWYVGATWRGDSSFCVTWWDGSANAYKVIFGNATASKGFVASAGKPTSGGIGYTTALVPAAKSASLKYGGLVVVTNWLGPPAYDYWAAVVPTPPPPPKKKKK